MKHPSGCSEEDGRQNSKRSDLNQLCSGDIQSAEARHHTEACGDQWFSGNEDHRGPQDDRSDYGTARLTDETARVHHAARRRGFDLPVDHRFAHGGRLWAEANEPRGAVFQFILPGAEKEFTTVLLVEASK
jgi:hypothetical protein